MIAGILAGNRVICTVTIDDVATAVPTAEALAAGGVQVVEVMLRNDAGLGAIAAIAAELPNTIVGAGTVLSVELLDGASEAGAAFAVSPGFDPDIARRAQAIRMPYLPGAVTASEIQTCLRHEIATVKFFPAVTSGGVGAIRSLSAAFSTAGVEFVPTGGIDDTNAFDYLELATVRAVGMSWVAEPSTIAAGDWATITARSAQISEHRENGTS